jgi:hypothetical protein
MGALVGIGTANDDNEIRIVLLKELMILFPNDEDLHRRIHERLERLSNVRDTHRTFEDDLQRTVRERLERGSKGP